MGKLTFAEMAELDGGHPRLLAASATTHLILLWCGVMATVRFCRAVGSAGVGQDARMRSQVEATLRQFPTIRAVRLLGGDGRCLFGGVGQDRCTVGRAPGAPESRAGAR